MPVVRSATDPISIPRSVFKGSYNHHWYKDEVSRPLESMAKRRVWIDR